MKGSAAPFPSAAHLRLLQHSLPQAALAAALGLGSLQPRRALLGWLCIPLQLAFFWEEKGNNIILFCAEMLFVCCKRNLKAGALRPPPQGTLQQQPMPPAPVFCRAESGLRGFPVSPQRNAGAGHGTDTRTDIGMDIGMSASTSLALATAKCVPWAGQIPPRWQQPICRAHAAGRVGGRRAEITV